MKVLVKVVGAAVVAVLMSPGLAAADTIEDALIPDAGGCVLTASISTRAVAQNVYAVRASGSADCGSGVNDVEVCVQEEDAGTWNNRSCGTGVHNSGGTASASAEYVCVPGQRYRARTIGSGTSPFIIQKLRSSAITCPLPPT